MLASDQDEHRPSSKLVIYSSDCIQLAGVCYMPIYCGGGAPMATASWSTFDSRVYSEGILCRIKIVQG